ncbi:MAG: hypothetical protein FWC79_03965 [Oscillospiraceae bacterium]|nr:hypothetical protein [Oscillospiraceae bacterium]
MEETARLYTWWGKQGEYEFIFRITETIAPWGYAVLEESFYIRIFQEIDGAISEATLGTTEIEIGIVEEGIFIPKTIEGVTLSWYHSSYNDSGAFIDGEFFITLEIQEPLYNNVELLINKVDEDGNLLVHDYAIFDIEGFSFIEDDFGSMIYTSSDLFDQGPTRFTKIDSVFGSGWVTGFILEYTQFRVNSGVVIQITEVKAPEGYMAADSFAIKFLPGFNVFDSFTWYRKQIGRMVECDWSGAIVFEEYHVDGVNIMFTPGNQIYLQIDVENRPVPTFDLVINKAIGFLWCCWPTQFSLFPNVCWHTELLVSDFVYFDVRMMTETRSLDK